MTILNLVEPVDAMMDNPFAETPVRGMRFEIAVDETLHTASVGGLRVFGSRFRPGEAVPFEVLLRPFHGPDRTVSGRVVLPPHVSPGPYTLWVGSAGNAEKLLAKRAPGRAVARNYEHLMELVTGRGRNDDLIVELTSQDRGLTVEGEEILAPPASVLSVLRMSRQVGSTDRVEGAVLARERIRTGFVLSGAQGAQVAVAPE
jgi:hypothetical protein